MFNNYSLDSGRYLISGKRLGFSREQLFKDRRVERDGDRTRIFLRSYRRGGKALEWRIEASDDWDKETAVKTVMLYLYSPSQRV